MILKKILQTLIYTIKYILYINNIYKLYIYSESKLASYNQSTMKDVYALPTGKYVLCKPAKIKIKNKKPTFRYEVLEIAKRQYTLRNMDFHRTLDFQDFINLYEQLKSSALVLETLKSTRDLKDCPIQEIIKNYAS